MTDSQLLREYAERRSEPAFGELVRRHIDFVYSAALRMVRDAHLAQDVTQAAFVALSQNARQLAGRPVLSGWLHRTAQNLAAKAVRSDVRRRAREQEAAAMNELLSTEPEAVWKHIAPHLDNALGELSDADRDALLLRYFERKSAREIAETLGVSDEAAQKRVNRAVERLRELFAKRGLTVGASGLAVVLSTNAVQAAPAALLTTVSTAAAATVGTAVATHATMKWINAKLITAVLSSAVVAGTTTHLVQQQETTRLRAENHDLAAQQAGLIKERDNALASVATQTDESNSQRQDQNELLRLRAEVGRLREQQAELAKVRQQNQDLMHQIQASRSTTSSPSPAPTLSPEEIARNQCINNLRQIDGASQQYALENGLTATNVVTAEQILPFLGRGTAREFPKCPSGGTYTFGVLTNMPTCSIPGHSFE